MWEKKTYLSTIICIVISRVSIWNFRLHSRMYFPVYYYFSIRALKKKREKRGRRTLFSSLLATLVSVLFRPCAPLDCYQNAFATHCYSFINPNLVTSPCLWTLSRRGRKGISTHPFIHFSLFREYPFKSERNSNKIK